MIMLQRLRSLKGNQHRSQLHQLKVEDHKGAVRVDVVQEDEVQVVQEDEVQVVQEDEVQEDEVQEDEVQEDEVQEDEVQEATGVVDEIILEMNRQMSLLKKSYV
jgi:Ran GTPase-activating protein (RanGAP) involved in mRNA processing and transport